MAPVNGQKKNPVPKYRDLWPLTDTASGGACQARPNGPRTDIIAHMFGNVKPCAQKKLRKGQGCKAPDPALALSATMRGRTADGNRPNPGGAAAACGSGGPQARPLGPAHSFSPSGGEGAGRKRGRTHRRQTATQRRTAATPPPKKNEWGRIRYKRRRRCPPPQRGGQQRGR